MISLLIRTNGGWWNSAFEFNNSPLWFFISTASDTCLYSGSLNLFSTLISYSTCSPLCFSIWCLCIKLLSSLLLSLFSCSFPPGFCGSHQTTLTYLINVHCTFINFGKKSPLHSLIRACMFINFWKISPLHVYFILINSMVLDPAHLFPLLYPACLFKPAHLFFQGFLFSLHIYLGHTFIQYTTVCKDIGYIFFIFKEV